MSETIQNKIDQEITTEDGKAYLANLQWLASTAGIYCMMLREARVPVDLIGPMLMDWYHKHLENSNY